MKTPLVTRNCIHSAKHIQMPSDGVKMDGRLILSIGEISLTRLLPIDLEEDSQNARQLDRTRNHIVLKRIP